MGIQPEGDGIRKAVQWISEQRKDNPDASLQKLIDQAGAKFNLTPKEAEYLARADEFKE